MNETVKIYSTTGRLAIVRKEDRNKEQWRKGYPLDAPPAQAVEEAVAEPKEEAIAPDKASKKKVKKNG